VQERKSSLDVQIAGRTDVGRVRRSNEDAFGIVEPLALAVICDGMGGAAGGEIASKVALEAFLDVTRREVESSKSEDSDRTRRALCRAAAAANRAVRSRAEYDTRFRGMGTTLVAARLDGNELMILNVGDSRAYIVRGGAARQMTADHSYVAEQMRMGLMTRREAEGSALRSAITRAIGIDDDVQPDFFTETIAAGDSLLLCSDGLVHHLRDEEIGEIAGDPTSTPAAICDRLVAEVNARGGTDNVTCVVMRFGALRARG
jgi:protein phosphatase